MTNLARLSSAFKEGYPRAARLLYCLGLAAASAALMCFAAYASVKIINIERSFHRADAVMLVQIEGIERVSLSGTECGFRYSGRVLDRFKSTRKVEGEITFGRHGGLTIGKRYLLFLEYVPSAEAAYQRAGKENNFEDLKDAAEKAKALDLAACGDTVPGFLFDSEIAWHLDGKSFRIDGIRPDELLDGVIRYLADGDLAWRIPQDTLFAYLKSLRPSLPR